MANIFLDANYFIDSVHRKPENDILESLENNTIYISSLSVHIYCYIFKTKIPNSKIIEQIEKFQIVNFSEDISNKALLGPTTDFEDNVQLHSAAIYDCDLFLTLDQNILKMKFFGKTKIASNLDKN